MCFGGVFGGVLGMFWGVFGNVSECFGDILEGIWEGKFPVFAYLTRFPMQHSR